MRRVFLVALIVILAAVGLLQLGYFDIGPVVVTREDQQKLVYRLEEPPDSATEPGVSFRIGVPVIERVKTFSRRWLFLDSKPVNIQTKEGVPLNIDNYVVWRIRDALKFDKSFPKGIANAENRIDREVNARVQEIVGTKTLDEVVTTQRSPMMQEITTETGKKLEEFGIEVADVRIVRTDLPDEVLDNVYGRMKAERERLAREHRANGDRRAREIRADADKEARITVAKAREQAEVVRGEGDAQATKIYADAHSTDPDFYEFTRSLEAYRNTIDPDTTLILSPESEFFRLFGAPNNGVGAR